MTSSTARQILSGDEQLATLDLAYYETGNVAIRGWSDDEAARRLRQRIVLIADDGGVVAVTENLAERAAALARQHGISVYGASYVAAGSIAGARLVSCDVRDLVSRGLAILPTAYVAVSGGPTV